MLFSGEKENLIHVSQAFVSHLMPSAPGDFVKIYLYALYCFETNRNMDIEQFSAELNFSPDMIIRAFEYWQDMGAIKIKNGKTVSFKFTKITPAIPHDKLYTHGDYNKTIQKLFCMRSFSASELKKLYDYTDTFGLSQDVVIMMLEYCIKYAGRDVPFSYMDKVAKTWASEGVNIEGAIIKLSHSERTSHDAAKILSHLGVTNRVPTHAEIELYNKWTHDWGFTLDSILEACKQTTSTASPGFKYLNTILEKLYNKNKILFKDVKQYFMNESSLNEFVKSVIHRLGAKNLSVSDELIAYYEKWVNEYGFSHAMIVYGAAKASVHKQSFAYLDAILSDWKKNNIFNQESHEEYTLKQKQLKRITPTNAAKIQSEREYSKEELDSLEISDITKEIIL